MSPAVSPTKEYKLVRADHADSDLRADVALNQIVICVLVLALCLTFLFSWFRTRDRGQSDVLAKQAIRIDAQEQRMNAVMSDMAGLNADLAGERKKLQDVADQVSVVGAELDATCQRHAAALVETQRLTVALIAQLQRFKRGDGNVEA